MHLTPSDASFPFDVLLYWDSACLKLDLFFRKPVKGFSFTDTERECAGLKITKFSDSMTFEFTPLQGLLAPGDDFYQRYCLTYGESHPWIVFCRFLLRINQRHLVDVAVFDCLPQTMVHFLIHRQYRERALSDFEDVLTTKCEGG
jgi:hypothetical protein